MFGQRQLQEGINRIIRFLFDAKEDYRLACKRGPDHLKPALTAKIEKRESMHMQLQQALTVLSGEPSDNGTVAADFKRDWERLRGTIARHGFESALRLAEQSDTKAAEQIREMLRLTMTDALRALLKDHLHELTESAGNIQEWITSAAGAATASPTSASPTGAAS